MKKCNYFDLQDFANLFSALISRIRMRLSIDEPLQTPEAYFRAKYPWKSYQFSHQDTKIQALEETIEWFNSQFQKTKSVIFELFESIGEIIYGNKHHFNEALKEVLQ